MDAAVRATSGRLESPYSFVAEVKGVVGLRAAKPEGMGTG